ncbi:MAG: lytic murein transglycosylase, partial [Sphingomicrobium sp.]
MFGGMALLAVSAMAIAMPSAQVQPPAVAKAAAPRPVQVAQTYAYPQPTYATPLVSPWQAHKQRLAALARAQGVRESTIQAVIPALQVNQRVMELDRAQRPTASSNYVQNYRSYLDRHITSSLINRGQSRYSAHWSNLSRIQSRTGVDP